MAFYTTLASYRTILSNRTYNVYLQISIVNGTQKIDSLLLRKHFCHKNLFPSYFRIYYYHYTTHKWVTLPYLLNSLLALLSSKVIEHFRTNI